MSTSHYAFRALPFLEQLPLVWAEGTFIARRWEEEDGGFFCEVYLNSESLEILRVRTFTSSGPLEDYACYVRLDDLNTANN
jgi:hypothetical protein